MFVEVPLLTRCCFCAPLRRGLLVWAYFNLIFNILIFGIGLIFLSTFVIYLFFSESVYYILAVIFTTLISFFFEIIFNFVLIVGCHKGNTTLLRLYYRFGIAQVVLLLTLGIITNASLAYNSLLTSISEYERSELWDLILILSSVCCVLLILHTYLLLLVRSEIMLLKPRSHFQFVNHTAGPECVMQTESITKR